jgi:hypothetical protein
MENCVVKIKQIYIENPIFDDIADCTYVCLCCGENPKRLPSVLKNIKILNPTQKVKLVYNKGYKNCPCSVSVNHDLVNIQTYIFEDAIRNNYSRILWLEDDFELPEKIGKDHISSISDFIKQNNPDIYGLGNISLPKITSIFSLHQKVVFNFLGLSHAVFYNKNVMRKLVKYYKSCKNPIELGIDTSIMYINNIEVYRYYTPLVFQKLPETENQKEGLKNQKFIIPLNLTSGIPKLLNLDKSLQPGYTIIYIVPYIIYLLILILCIVLIKYIYKKQQK